VTVYEIPKCYCVDQDGSGTHRLMSIYGLLYDIESGHREPIVSCKLPENCSRSSSSRSVEAHEGTCRGGIYNKSRVETNPGF
jgi:hypothetical protein